MTVAMKVNIREGFWITVWFLVGLVLPTIAADKLWEHVYARRCRLERLALERGWA